jgi:hypothetical protein
VGEGAAALGGFAFGPSGYLIGLSFGGTSFGGFGCLSSLPPS